MPFLRFINPKIGLALGGGGARGMAHIGVLKVLEREKIPVHLIAGTSAGSLVGAMYAQLVDAQAVENRMMRLLRRAKFKRLFDKLPKQNQKSNHPYWDRMITFLKKQYIMNRTVYRNSLLDRRMMDEAISALLDDEMMGETHIPFSAVAADLLTGKSVVLKTGSIRKAVIASSTIPGTFPPMEWQGACLVDGSVSQMVPVWEAIRMGADLVIAVDVTRDLNRQVECTSGFDILCRADEITNHHLKELVLKDADVVIRPHVADIHWASFNRTEDLIRIGEEATQEMMVAIRQAIRSHRRGWLGRFFKKNSKKIRLAENLP